MSPKRSKDHVGLYGKEVACFHCGAREAVIHSDQPNGIGISSPAWEGMMAHCRAFEKIHLRCPETDHSPTRKLETTLAEWERGLFVGLSSATIFLVMTGRHPAGLHTQGDAPRDPSDFGRCHRLLRVCPEWRKNLHLVAAKFPKWAGIVEHWDELTAMYERQDPEMYDRMQAIAGDTTPF